MKSSFFARLVNEFCKTTSLHGWFYAGSNLAGSPYDDVTPRTRGDVITSLVKKIWFVIIVCSKVLAVLVMWTLIQGMIN